MESTYKIYHLRLHGIIEIEKPETTPYFMLETLNKERDLP